MTNSPDEQLFRAVEGAYNSIPKTVRISYERDEIVNAIWLLMKRRGISKPSRLQIRMAAIDHHRTITHYRRRKIHGDSFTNIDFMGQNGSLRNEGRAHGLVTVPAPSEKPRQETKAEISSALEAIRMRYGTEGLAVFLLTQILEIDRPSVKAILRKSEKAITAWVNSFRSERIGLS